MQGACAVGLVMSGAVSSHAARQLLLFSIAIPRYSYHVDTCWTFTQTLSESLV